LKEDESQKGDTDEGQVREHVEEVDDSETVVFITLLLKGCDKHLDTILHQWL
jgi:hypothetical protein